MPVGEVILIFYSFFSTKVFLKAAAAEGWHLYAVLLFKFCRHTFCRLLLVI